MDNSPSQTTLLEFRESNASLQVPEERAECAGWARVLARSARLQGSYDEANYFEQLAHTVEAHSYLPLVGMWRGFQGMSSLMVPDLPSWVHAWQPAERT